MLTTIRTQTNWENHFYFNKWSPDICVRMWHRLTSWQKGTFYKTQCRCCFTEAEGRSGTDSGPQCLSWTPRCSTSTVVGIGTSPGTVGDVARKTWTRPRTASFLLVLQPVGFPDPGIVHLYTWAITWLPHIACTGSLPLSKQINCIEHPNHHVQCFQGLSVCFVLVMTTTFTGQSVENFPPTVAKASHLKFSHIDKVSIFFIVPDWVIERNKNTNMKVNGQNSEDKKSIRKKSWLWH